MSQNRKISSFFTQRPAKRPAAEPIDTDVEIDEPETSGAATPMEVGPFEPDFGTAHVRDFGRIIGKARHMTPADKYEWLTNFWKPPPNYDFPTTFQREKKRHTSIESFMELVEVVMGALVEINQNDRTTDANYFLLQMNDTEFLFALVLLHRVMELLKPATACLQTEGLDLLEAKKLIKTTTDTLKDWKNQEVDSVGSFTNVSQQAQALYSRIQANAYYKRTTRRLSGETTDWDSFKEMHEKFLRHIRFALKDRFGDLFEKVGHLQELFPWNSPNTAFESLKPALDFYRNSALDFTDDEFKVQFELWQKFCSNYQGELTFDGAIKFCNKAHFPIIYDLLKIFGITPVTTDIAERSFSSLKLLKTYLRNRTKEERLSSMALAYINQDVAIESSDIAEFFIQKNRRLDFGSEKDDEKTEFVENIEL